MKDLNEEIEKRIAIYAGALEKPELSDEARSRYSGSVHALEGIRGWLLENQHPILAVGNPQTPASYWR